MRLSVLAEWWFDCIRCDNNEVVASDKVSESFESDAGGRHVIPKTDEYTKQLNDLLALIELKRKELEEKHGKKVRVDKGVPWDRNRNPRLYSDLPPWTDK